jgi:flagellar hook protein FlgE
MGLQSALSTALTGMNAAETIIDVAGNNVANSQTVGFKESGVNFATQFLQTISIGAAPSAGNGGTNPRQIGLGVKVAEISPDFTQGTIEISSNPLDVAIQGDGFLIVQGGQGEQLYTRNGQLKTNQNNEVVSISGNRVLGYNAVDGVIGTNLEPLVIPIGGSVVNRVTSTASFSGTLTPTSSVGVASIIESDVLSNGAFPVPADFVSGSIGATPPIDITGAVGTGDGTPVVAGIPAAGTYSYRVTYVDGNGNETAGSTAFTVTSAGGNIDLTNLPTPDGTDYTGYNIYRTVDGGTSYFKVNGGTPIDDSVSVFQDTNDDTELIANAALNTTSLSNGDYSYYVTFYRQSDGIETRPNALEGPLTVNTPNSRIRLNNIPQPSAQDITDGFTQVRIYRTLSDSNDEFYRLATIPTGQASYMDSASDASIENTSNLIDLDGPKITNDTLLTNVVQRSGSDYVNVFSGPGTLTYQATKGGKAIPEKTFEIGATTTVLDYLRFLQQASGINTGVPDSPAVVVSGGKIVVESNKGTANAISIGPASFEFTPSTPGATPQTKNLGFEQTQQAVGEGTFTEFVVYDSLGIPLTVQLTTVLETKNDSSTEWRWFATSGDNEPLPENGVTTAIGTGTFVYDDNGVFDLANSGLLSFVIERNATASESPLEVDLDFTQTNGKGTGASRMNFTTQDGFPPGVLTDFSITETGEIRGVYSNGVGQTLGQIVMARFTNNGGLQQVGSNMFTIGVNSGAPQYGIPGDAGLGSLTAGAVELSNTDIGQNLIDLILASTQYRGGARVITAVQELLDELMALQR